MGITDKIKAQKKLFSNVFEKEGAAFVWSFLYFFSLLMAYFILRPIRDAMGIASGVGFLPWLFTAVFFVMLAVMPIYGWLVSKFPRHKFIPYVYVFFVINLGLFWFFFANDIRMDIVAQIFFVWLSVFNLFVVSVFWSFMVDIYKSEDSKALFGLIASGGTLGGILGTGMVSFLTEMIGVENLLLISAALLIFAIQCVLKLVSLREGDLKNKGNISEVSNDNGLGGGMIDGLTEILRSSYLAGISVIIFLLSLTATFLYFQQGDLIWKAYPETEERVEIFGQIDFYVQIGALIFQVFVSGPLMSNMGVKAALIILPIVTLIGFAVLAISPTVGVIIVFQVIRRATEYGTMVPSRENLFSIVSREEKYKAKNFIDTALFRGSDVVNGWFYSLLNATMSLSISVISLIALPFALIWGMLAWKLGRIHEEKSN